MLSGSFTKALERVYPEYNLQPWRFTRVPNGYWADSKNMNAYFHWVKETMKNSNVSDWASFSQHMATLCKGTQVAQRVGGLEHCARKYFPQYATHFGQLTKSQLILLQTVQNLFPDLDVLTDFVHPDLVFPQTKRPMQIDVFLPSLSLGLEYQGEQHYKWHFLIGSPSDQQVKDSEKKIQCEKHGITLIEVPYWWDKKSESLAATVRLHRPGLTNFVSLFAPYIQFRSATRTRFSLLRSDFLNC